VKNDAVKTIVFDFDGTLVQSKMIKLQAWHEVFNEDEALQAAIYVILDRYAELSRYIIIRKILEHVYGDSLSDGVFSDKIALYAQRYNSLVLSAVKTCAEMPGATMLLDDLSRELPLYCFSHTPETKLQEIIRYRGWETYFKEIYGYPRKKEETIDWIQTSEQILPQELLVVGDGLSDKAAADSIGAQFVMISDNEDLAKIPSFLS
jgi:phosphoglycolate phosphatase-like HAD superfamily hydrolase